MTSFWQRGLLAKRAFRVAAVVVVGVLVASGVAWGVSGLRVEHTGPRADDTATFWTGTSTITSSRSTPDLSAGYTMRADFWFRVDPDGKVTGKAYAMYQPTFDATGLNARIALAKGVVTGVMDLLPGGELAVAKKTIDALKKGRDLGLGALTGVAGTYKDPRPIRSGDITGTWDGRTLKLDWANPGREAAGIPITTGLQYIGKVVPLKKYMLAVEDPWKKDATADSGSSGRLAVAQNVERSTSGGVSVSTTSYWSATRVG